MLKKIFQNISPSHVYFGWVLFIVSCPCPHDSAILHTTFFSAAQSSKQQVGDPCLEILLLPLHCLQKLAQKYELQISQSLGSCLTQLGKISGLPIPSCPKILDGSRPGTSVILSVMHGPNEGTPDFRAELGAMAFSQISKIILLIHYYSLVLQHSMESIVTWHLLSDK